MKKLLSGVLSVVLLFSFFTNGLSRKNCEASFYSSSYNEDKEENQYDVNSRIIVSIPSECSLEAETETKKEKSGFLIKVINLLSSVFSVYVSLLSFRLLQKNISVIAIWDAINNFLDKNIYFIEKVFRPFKDKGIEVRDKIIGSEEYQKFVQPYITKFKNFFADENKSES